MRDGGLEGETFVGDINVGVEGEDLASTITGGTGRTGGAIGGFGTFGTFGGIGATGTSGGRGCVMVGTGPRPGTEVVFEVGGGGCIFTGSVGGT